MNYENIPKTTQHQAQTPEPHETLPEYDEEKYKNENEKITDYTFQ